MKNAQQKVLTGTVLLMAAVLLGGCASTSTTSTTTHKATSAKVVKKANKSSNKEAKNATSSSSESFVAVPASSSSSSTQSSVASSAPQANVTRQATPASAAANYQKSAPATTKRSDTDVLNSFIAASGLQQAGNSYLVQDQGNGQYRVEVRNTGKDQDQNVANLTGLYNYNINNNQIQKMDPVTGQFN